MIMFGGFFGENKVEVKVAEVSGKSVGDGEVVAEVAKSKMAETLVLGSLFGLCKGVGFGILNPTNTSLNEAEKTAVVTAVTTADAIGLMVKTTMQVTLMVTPTLDTLNGCV
ncbi:hypothetical protein Tco_0476366 [Tanacetum coccineum]